MHQHAISIELSAPHWYKVMHASMHAWQCLQPGRCIDEAQVLKWAAIACSRSLDRRVGLFPLPQGGLNLRQGEDAALHQC